MTAHRVPDGNGNFIRVDPHAAKSGFVEPAYNFDPAAAPPAGSAALFPKTVAGRERWYQQAASGSVRPVGDELWSKAWCLITPLSSAALRTDGIGGAAVAVGTVSHPGTTGNGYLAQIVSPASTTATATVQSSGSIVRRGTAGDAAGGFLYRARLYLPDASYDNAGASTGSRLWAGLSNSSSAVPTDRGSTFHVAAFVRAHVNGGTTDANWQFVTNAGGTGTSTVADTGVPFVAQHLYSFEMWCPLGGATVYWRIRDITAGIVEPGSVSATLPAAATALAAIAGLETVDAVARAFQFAHVYYEADQG